MQVLARQCTPVICCSAHSIGYLTCCQTSAYTSSDLTEDSMKDRTTCILIDGEQTCILQLSALQCLLSA